MSEVNTWPGWRCVRQLGKGSYGKVYEIETVENGNIRRAALKVMSVPVAPEDVQEIYDAGYASTEKEASAYIDNQIEIISREFKMMSELQGRSNIVEFEDYQIIPHENWIGADILIRMELLTPLNQYMRSVVLTDTDIVHLGIDICHALQICHTMHPVILHRDIKIANIMVDDRGNFKLGDFGIARIVDGTQCAHTRIGTWSYMAPEVYKGQGYFVTADIYSLGMVLYRLLNNNRDPFVLTEGVLSDQTYESAQSLRLSGEKIPAPLRGSETLKRVVQKALAYEPYERFKTAEEFSVALKNCPEFMQKNAGQNQYMAYSGADQTEVIDEESSVYNRTNKIIEEETNHSHKRTKFPLVLAGIGVIAICILGKWMLSGTEKNVAEKSSITSTAPVTAEADSSVVQSVQIVPQEETRGDTAVHNSDNVATDIPENAVACVENEYYTSVNEAISEMKGNTTLSLVADVHENVVIPQDKDITLDLNMHTVSDDGDHTIINYGVLRVQGDGTVDNVAPNKAALVNEQGAQAYLYGGKFIRSEENGTENGLESEENTYYTVVNRGAMRLDGCLIQNRGTHSTTLHNGWTREELQNGVDDYAYMLISGGKIEGGIFAVKNDLHSSLDITDGEFSGSKKALIYNKTKIVIEGGSFTDAPVAIMNQGDGKASISDMAKFDTDTISNEE